jgi:DNA repair protein RadC
MTITEMEKQYSVESFKIRYKAMSPPPKKDLMTSPGRVITMARGVISEFDGGMSIEHFGVIYVNVQNEMIGLKVFNTGTIDQVAVYPRMIIHTGLMLAAGGVILFHNHPSGNCEPSEEDRRMTNSIKDAGKLFDIRILDHLVISENSHSSFLERGWL